VSPLTFMAMRPLTPTVALGVDEFDHARARRGGTHDELLVGAVAREAGEEVEQLAYVVGDLGVTGRNPKSS